MEAQPIELLSHDRKRHATRSDGQPHHRICLTPKDMIAIAADPLIGGLSSRVVGASLRILQMLNIQRCKMTLIWIRVPYRLHDRQASQVVMLFEADKA